MAAARSQRRGRARRERISVPVMLLIEQHEALHRLSDRMDLPCSVLIRQAIDRMLKEAGLLQEQGQ